MSKHERLARIEGIDLTTGVFPMTLATEGEASDGHILSIAGGQIPERMPMLSSHWNEPTAQLGSILEPEKRLRDKPPRLRANGHIELSGEGPSAEIRRDLAHMIDKGHVTGVSIRWDEVPGKTIRRVNLPSDHPHFVDGEKANGPERWGMYFEEWRALEGSVVSVGADPKALIGRADETNGEVRAFWRSMAREVSQRAEEWVATLAALRVHADSVRSKGVAIEDLINAVAGDGVEDLIDDLEPITYEGRVLFLPASLAERLEARAEVASDLTPPETPAAETPAAIESKPDQAETVIEVRTQPSRLTFDASQLYEPRNVEALAGLLSQSLDEYEQRINRTVTTLIELQTGKVK